MESTAGQGIIEKIIFCCLKLEEWEGGADRKYRDKMQEYRYKLKRLRSRRDSQGVRDYNEVR